MKVAISRWFGLRVDIIGGVFVAVVMFGSIPLTDSEYDVCPCACVRACVYVCVCLFVCETWTVLLWVTSPAPGGFACTRLKCHRRPSAGLLGCNSHVLYGCRRLCS